MLSSAFLSLHFKSRKTADLRLGCMLFYISTVDTGAFVSDDAPIHLHRSLQLFFHFRNIMKQYFVFCLVL